MVDTQVKVTKVLNTQLTFTKSSGSWGLTYANVGSMIPGGQTYWNRIRVLKVSVWGAAGDGKGEADQLRVTVNSNPAWDTPVAQYIDSGTAGNKRPAISFEPDVITSMRSIGSADPEIICTIQQVPTEDGTENIVVIHVTAELTGPVGV